MSFCPSSPISPKDRICYPTAVGYLAQLCPNLQEKGSLAWKRCWADTARSCRLSRVSPDSWPRPRGSGRSTWGPQAMPGLREPG